MIASGSCPSPDEIGGEGLGSCGVTAGTTKTPLPRFVVETAQRLRIPFHRVEAATCVLMRVLGCRLPPAEFDAVSRQLCIQDLVRPAAINKGHRVWLDRLAELFAPLVARSVGTRRLLEHAGLPEHAVVPFVSAFVRLARARLEAGPLQRVFDACPCLERLGWMESGSGGQ